MRWLFLLLLIANIAYVGWELNHEPAAEPDIATVTTDTPRIVLLRELQRGSAAPVMKPSAEDVVPAPQEPAEMPPTTAMADADDADTVIDEPLAAAAAVQVEPPAIPADIAPSQPSETQSAQPAGEDQCFTLGPFRELDQLSAVTQAIKSYVVETEFRSREESKPPMFWVYLESAGSLAKAKILSKELERKKVGDYFILISGEHKYGISLGIFREKARANRHENRIRKLGFEPVIEPIVHTYTIYWLDYRMKAGDAIPPQVFEAKLPESANILDRPCQP